MGRRWVGYFIIGLYDYTDRNIPFVIEGRKQSKTSLSYYEMIIWSKEKEEPWPH